MEDTWEDIIGERTPTAKDLLKLVVRRGTVTPDEAAREIGVKRGEIDPWIKALIAKKYVIVEGLGGANQVIKPTLEILAKLEVMKKKGIGQSVSEDGTVLGRELAKEIQKRQELELEVREKEYIIAELRSELTQEKKENADLKDGLAKMETEAPPADEESRRLQELLEREREERLKIEAVIRKRDEELAAWKSGRGGAEETKPEKAEENPGKPLQRWSQVAMKTDIQIAKGGEKRGEETSQGQAEPAKIDSIPEDDTTRLLNLLSKKGRMKMKDAARELKIEESSIAKIASELQKYVEAKKSIFSGTEIALKEGVDAKDAIGELQADKIRGEFKRLRGGP